MKKLFVLCLFMLSAAVSLSGQYLADTIRVLPNAVECVYKKPTLHYTYVYRSEDVRFILYESTVEMWAGSYTLFSNKYSNLKIDTLTVIASKKAYIRDSFYLSSTVVSSGGSGGSYPTYSELTTAYTLAESNSTGSITGTDVMSWTITNTGSASGVVTVVGNPAYTLTPGASLSWETKVNLVTDDLIMPPSVTWNATGTTFLVAATDDN